MNRKIISLAICFFIVSLLSVYGMDGIDDLIGDIYLDNAYDQFKESNFKEAYRLSEISLSFSPLVSDSLLIRAVSGRNIGENSSSVNDLVRALVNNNWERFEEITARVYLSSYLYLEGNRESAYINLEPFRDNLSSSSFYTKVFIKIAISLAKIPEAVDAALDRLLVDPYDSYSQQTAATFSSSWLLEATKNILEGDPSSYYSKEVVQSIIKRSSEYESLLSFYKSRWGDDRFYSLAKIKVSEGNPEQELKVLYGDNSRISYDELQWVAGLLQTEEQKSWFENYLHSINLEIMYDYNNDFINETRALYSNGIITQFSYDKNQDGKFDFIIDFKMGISSKLVILEKNRKISFFYRNYPDLIKVIDLSANYKDEYRLIPYTVDFDIINTPDSLLGGVPSVVVDYDIPETDTLIANSTEKLRKDLNTSLISRFRRVSSEEGKETVYESDGTKVIEKHFENSILITLYRDFNSDGQFDTVYTYKDAVLVSITFDSDNNGIVDYMENYGKTSLKSWDLNGDGIFDIRDVYKDGKVVREISTGLNGEFDTSVEIFPGTVQ